MPQTNVDSQKRLARDKITVSDIWSFTLGTIPIFLSMLVSGLNNIIDYLTIGLFLDPIYMAIGGVLVPVFMLITTWTSSFCLGSASILSKYFRSDLRKFRSVNGLYLYTLLIVTSLVVIVLWIYTPNLVNLLNVNEEIGSLTEVYCRIYSISYIFRGVSAYYCALLRIGGDSKRLIGYSLVSLVSNLIFNLILVGSLGLHGVVIATVISSVVSMIYVIIATTKINENFKVARFGWDFSMVVRVLRVSSPVAMEGYLLVLILSITTYLINKSPLEVVAGYSISTQICVILYTYARASSSLVSIRIGSDIGEREFNLVKKTYRIGVLSCFSFSVFLSLLLIPLAYVIFGYLISETYLSTVILLFAVDIVSRITYYPYYHSFNGLTQGVEETKISMTVYYVSLLIVRVPLMFVLEGIWGIIGILISMALGGLAHGLTGRFMLNHIVRVGLTKFIASYKN